MRPFLFPLFTAKAVQGVCSGAACGNAPRTPADTCACLQRFRTNQFKNTLLTDFAVLRKRIDDFLLKFLELLEGHSEFCGYALVKVKIVIITRNPSGLRGFVTLFQPFQ